MQETMEVKKFEKVDELMVSVYLNMLQSAESYSNLGNGFTAAVKKWVEVTGRASSSSAMEEQTYGEDTDYGQLIAVVGEARLAVQRPRENLREGRLVVVAEDLARTIPEAGFILSELEKSVANYDLGAAGGGNHYAHRQAALQDYTRAAKSLGELARATIRENRDEYLQMDRAA